jgi:hypothetical protein
LVELEIFEVLQFRRVPRQRSGTFPALDGHEAIQSRQSAKSRAFGKRLFVGEENRCMTLKWLKEVEGTKDGGLGQGRSARRYGFTDCCSVATEEQNLAFCGPRIIGELLASISPNCGGTRRAIYGNRRRGCGQSLERVPSRHPSSVQIILAAFLREWPSTGLFRLASALRRLSGADRAFEARTRNKGLPCQRQ